MDNQHKLGSAITAGLQGGAAEEEVGQVLGAGGEGAVPGGERDDPVWLGVLGLLALERGWKASSRSSNT